MKSYLTWASISHEVMAQVVHVTNPHRFRQARAERGFTLKRASEELGVSLNTVWRYERGDIQPSLAIMHQYSLLFEKPINWFLHSPHVPDSEIGELLAPMLETASDKTDVDDHLEVNDQLLAQIFPKDWHAADDATKQFVKVAVQSIIEGMSEFLRNEPRRSSKHDG